MKVLRPDRGQRGCGKLVCDGGAMDGRLRVIHDEIAERVAAICETRPDWPCRRGCDACCRRLAEPLRLTSVEWERVGLGIAELPPAQRQKVEDRMHEAATTAQGPWICPLLERRSGACRIYEHRPAACRMYGFFRARDGGRFCQRIADKVALEGEEDLVWGYHEAMERALERHFGAPMSRTAWLAKP